MYIYRKDKSIFNTEQISEISVYKKTNAEWRLCAISGGVEARIASYNSEQAAEIVLNAIMSAIKDNVQVLDIDAL